MTKRVFSCILEWRDFYSCKNKNMWFNISEYQNQVIKEIETRLENVNKLYLEVVGNCIDQSAFWRIINGFPADLWKRTFSHFKYDMEIFFCVRAEDILDENKEREWWKEFKDFLTPIKWRLIWKWWSYSNEQKADFSLRIDSRIWKINYSRSSDLSR